MYEGFSCSQEYTTEWNEGYLKASGFTIGGVIYVLKLRPGELMNGNSEYDTTWEDKEPDELPEDRDLYISMNIGNVEYEWHGASSIEFELID